MKAPKVLRYDWTDLTGLEELDSSEMEDLRLMFRTMGAAGIGSCKNILQQFFAEHATDLLLRPTSDLSVVLFRLLVQSDKETLNTTAFAITVKSTPLGESLSFGQFVDLVAESFFFTKRPMPIVSGTPPRIWL